MSLICQLTSEDIKHHFIIVCFLWLSFLWQGPETESLTVGEVGGRLLIVAGNERPGTIAVFSVAAGGMAPVFETLYSEGIPHNDSRTWQQIYDDGHLFALDPEYIQ